MLSTLLLASLLGAWDDFEPMPANAEIVVRRPTEADFDDMQRSIAAWQTEQREAARDRLMQQKLLAQRVAASVGTPVELLQRPKLDAKTQREVDAAEARGEDLRLRCREHPESCGGSVSAQRSDDGRDAALNAKEQALKAREESLAKRQQELDEAAEKAKTELEQRKKTASQLSSQAESLLRGLSEGLGQ